MKNCGLSPDLQNHKNVVFEEHKKLSKLTKNII